MYTKTGMHKLTTWSKYLGGMYWNTFDQGIYGVGYFAKYYVVSGRL